MRRKGFVLMFAGFLAVYFSALSFAQEQQSDQQPAVGRESPAVTADAPAAPAGPESPATAIPIQTEWLYGEVNSVDIANKAIVLIYLDYDTDIEKQATVYTDAKTIFENAVSLEEVKPQDMASIDYIIGADNKNLAVSISVEKPESVEDFNLEPQVPSATGPEMKPAREVPATPAQENSASSDSESEPVKAQ